MSHLPAGVGQQAIISAQVARPQPGHVQGKLRCQTLPALRRPRRTRFARLHIAHKKKSWWCSPSSKPDQTPSWTHTCSCQQNSCLQNLSNRLTAPLLRSLSHSSVRGCGSGCDAGHKRHSARQRHGRQEQCALRSGTSLPPSKGLPYDPVHLKPQLPT